MGTAFLVERIFELTVGQWLLLAFILFPLFMGASPIEQSPRNVVVTPATLLACTNTSQHSLKRDGQNTTIKANIAIVTNTCVFEKMRFDLQGKTRLSEINLRQVPKNLGNRGDQDPHPSVHSPWVSMILRPLLAAANYRFKDNALPTIVDGQSLVVVVSNQRDTRGCTRSLGRKSHQELGVFAKLGFNSQGAAMTPNDVH